MGKPSTGMFTVKRDVGRTWKGKGKGGAYVPTPGKWFDMEYTATDGVDVIFGRCSRSYALIPKTWVGKEVTVRLLSDAEVKARVEMTRNKILGKSVA